VGNIVAPSGPGGVSVGDFSEAAAIEYALGVLGIRDIAVCGHSNCGAMKAVLSGREALRATTPNLAEWLAHAEPARAHLALHPIDSTLPESDRLSQANVLQQLDHVATFPIVQRLLGSGELQLHGLWFDIAHAMVWLYEDHRDRFIALDEAELVRLLTPAT
jgi:carbonic anhydrase